MTEFAQQVIAMIKKIPKGKVATYGQIAALAGKPHAARGVSWILSSSTKAHQLPWFRVIGSAGKISIPKSSKGFKRQRDNLRAEKVEVAVTGEIDLKKFGWKKTPRKIKKRNTPRMFS